MKVPLNKKTLADMPTEVREVVQAWKEKTGRRDISVENTNSLYISEDSKFTLINLETGKQKTARASGEYAGATALDCNTYLPLPVGIVAIETSIFMGKHFLTVHQGSHKMIEPEWTAPNRSNW
jgi:hypothetical protein